MCAMNVFSAADNECIATAASSGCFSFDYPSTQQQMLVWKARPQWCASAPRAYAGHLTCMWTATTGQRMFLHATSS